MNCLVIFSARATKMCMACTIAMESGLFVLKPARNVDGGVGTQQLRSRSHQTRSEKEVLKGPVLGFSVPSEAIL